jgi:hypothetical protein
MTKSPVIPGVIHHLKNPRTSTQLLRVLLFWVRILITATLLYCSRCISTTTITNARSMVFWTVTLCTLEIARRFGEHIASIFKAEAEQETNRSRLAACPNQSIQSSSTSKCWDSSSNQATTVTPVENSYLLYKPSFY